MRRRIIVLCGLPGIGKSTLADALVGQPRTYDGLWTIGATHAALGRYDLPTGQGVDSLAFVGPKVGREQGIPTSFMVRWIARAPADRVLVLDHVRFDLAALEGHDVTAYHLSGPAALASSRRAQRGSRWMPFDWWVRMGARDAFVTGRLGARQIDATRPTADVLHLVT